jgi:FemAB-related protein (PEP-CTERM system-associated)
VKPAELPFGSSSVLAVRSYEDRDRGAWSSFVHDCAEATFFHRIEWRDLIEKVFRHRTHYLLAERAGAVVGVLPLARVRSWLFGDALVSLPFAVYGGAAVAEESAREALHQSASELARGLGVQHLELRNRHATEPDWPRQDLYVTFRKALLPDVEANLLAIPRKQRAMVRKGIERGLSSELDETADRFFALYADNQHRHGTPPYPRRYFEALRAAFGADCQILTVLDTAGMPVSSVMSFYFRDEVLPYYAGDHERARALAANDFKYWELMRRAVDGGLKVFDYGRSKQGTGSFSFKKNWGFEAQSLHYEYLLLKRDSVPQNNPSNPKYRAFIETWRRLPRPLANAIGPSIVRNLG